MEALFGITGHDFVLVASDPLCVRSIVVMKHNEDKSRQLNRNAVMLFNGESGDTVQFAEYIQCNVKLFGIKNGIEMTPQAVAHFTRKELATALRTKVTIAHGYMNTSGSGNHYFENAKGVAVGMMITGSRKSHLG